MAGSDGFPVLSEVLEAESEDEHEWLVNAARRLWGVPGGDCVEDWPTAAKDLLSTDFEDIYGNMPKWKPLKRKMGILIYSDDGCNLSAISPLVQLYIRRYHCEWYWWVEWAEISERPLPGGFRGGALFVTEQHVAWHFTTHWINEMIERSEIQHGG